MRRRFVRQSSLNWAIGSVLLLLAVTVTACGTLDISLNQTPEPTPAAISTESGAVQSEATEIVTTPEEAAAGWGPLIPYTHPAFGYELLIPEGATFIEEDTDEDVTVFSDSGPEDSPSYAIAVKVVPAADLSPEELLSVLSDGETDLLDVEPVEMNSGDGQGALVSYSVGAGSTCPEMRPLMAAFVDRDTGYAISVFSDSQGHCEAINVPEVMTIIESFRPPAASPVPAMTPTPTPGPVEDLVVVYTRDHNAWLWTESGGERQLTKDGGVDQVLLSDDKGVVAFRRGNGLWAVNADGSNERQLVKENDMPVPQEGELAGSITGMTINQLEWIPGSRQLLFNTRMVFDGPGLLLSDDLWRVDADGLFLENLFAPGDGGNFAIAPDGRQVALITPDSISLASLDGADKQRIFGYTPVITYSEFRYYARPIWSPSGDTLGVIVPPPDPLGTENQAHGIWRLHTDGTPAVLAGTIETRGNRPLPEPSISPGLEMIAYLSGSEVEPERVDLLFVSWGDTVSSPTFYTSGVDSFGEWAPGGERFSFTRPPGQTGSIIAFTGRLDEEPQQVGSGEAAAITVHWVDDDRYLYLQASAKGWDLILADGDGSDVLVAAVVGQPPAFDAKG